MARWSILLLLALGLPAAPISAAPIVAPAAELTRTGDAMLASVHTAGEDCLGCGWAPTDTDYSTVDAIEIVNGGGKRKTPGDLGAAIGSLATVVRADALSQGASLRGLRSGRMFVDLDEGRGRVLDLTARRIALANGAVADAATDIAFTLHHGVRKRFRTDVRRSDGRRWLIGNPVYVR